MENVIKRIIAIEDKAESVMADARREEQELDARVKEESEKLGTDILQRASDKCRYIKSVEEDEVLGKINKITSETEAQLFELEKKYTENKEKWVDNMVKHIIGE